ncbi:hypothetical protein BJX64DRAFT_287537 [Aspergillus heterothallicus]
MRSGLRKPGTVPFLALVLFSLLSLVPTLAKEWDFYSAHLTYLGLPLPRYDGLGRYSSSPPSSRVRNASSSLDGPTRPRQRITTTGGSNPCKSWLLGDFYSSCVDVERREVPPHQSAVMGTPPRSSLFEAGMVPGGGDTGGSAAAVTHAAPKAPSSSLTRGVTAFKEFVIRRWDEQIQSPPELGVLDSDSDLDAPSAAMQQQPAVPVVIVDSVTAAPAMSKEIGSGYSESSELSTADSTADSDSFLFRLSVFLHETWQLACHTGGQSLDSWSRSSTRHNISLIHEPAATSDEQIRLDDIRSEQSQPPIRELNHQLNDPAQQEQVPLHIPPPSHPVSTAGQSKDAGFRHDSQHMRGSSMAIVIGLVVGIMWF